MHLILTNKKELVRDVKIGSSLGCSEHGDGGVQDPERREQSKQQDLQLWTSGEWANVFRELLGRIPWDKALDRRGVQESLMVFRDHHQQDQKQSIPTFRKSS